MQVQARPGRPAVQASLAWLMVITALLFLLSLGIAAPTFPPLTGRVVDEAALLSREDISSLTADLDALEAKSTDQLVVVTLRSLQGYPIEDYGYQLGRAWQIGQGKLNNGVLLIVAPNERRVRIEVGRGLEPQLTDALSQIIIQNGILPAFRRGEWAGGIKAGVRDIGDVLLGDVQAVKDRLASGTKRTKGIDWEAYLPLIVWLVILAFVLYTQRKQARQMPESAAGRRPGYGDRDVVYTPGGWGGSGHWGGGAGSGGGFSGGGGDFGGGGSSGSW